MTTPPLQTSVESREALPFAERCAVMLGSVIDASTTLLRQQTHDVVKFGMGSPAAEAIPTKELAALAGAVLAHPTDDAFDYGPTEGEASLRLALEEFLAEHDEPIQPERLLITSSGMQGIDLVCKLFLNPGDIVAAESPTFTNAVSTITSYEGRLMEISIDAEGINVDELAALVAAEGRPPKIIYTVPTFQNPTGVTLSLARREQLLELAAGWGSSVLEDEPYRLLGFANERPIPSLAALSNNAPWVVGVHTFSKILAPGLRVGWLNAAPEIVKRMVDAKQGMDTCTNVPAQRLITAFLREGGMEAHLERLRALYLERKLAMQQALASEFAGSGATWTDPDGGFFLWFTLPGAIDTSERYPAALAEGVAYIPGAAFTVGDGFKNSLRLCFASTDPDRMRIGIERLRRALLP